MRAALMLLLAALFFAPAPARAQSPTPGHLANALKVVPPELDHEWMFKGRLKLHIRVQQGHVELVWEGKTTPFVVANWSKPRLDGWRVGRFKKSVRDRCPQWREPVWVPIKLTLSSDGSRLEGQWRNTLVREHGTGGGIKPCEIESRRWVPITFKRVAPATGRIRVVAAANSGALLPAQIALVLDASGSMRQHLPDGTTKIATAKRVMRAVIKSLPAQAMVGLRVYGHRYRSRPKRRSCRDSELLVPFGRDNHARLIAAIDRLRPHGQTPIGLSLARLAGDFGDVKGFRLVVLVSDGIETCAPRPTDALYPVRVVKQLRALGLKLRVNVVGLDIGKSKTRAFLERIATETNGGYFDAKDARQLEAALKRAFAASFVVRTPAGQTIAKGTVGGPAVIVPVGKYRVSIAGAATLTADNVVVSKDRESLLTVARVNGQVQVQRTVH